VKCAKRIGQSPVVLSGKLIDSSIAGDVVNAVSSSAVRMYQECRVGYFGNSIGVIFTRPFPAAELPCTSHCVVIYQPLLFVLRRRASALESASNSRTRRLLSGTSGGQLNGASRQSSRAVGTVNSIQDAAQSSTPRQKGPILSIRPTQTHRSRKRLMRPRLVSSR